MSDPIFDEHGWCHDMEHPQATSGERVLVYVKDFDNITEAWYCDVTGLWPKGEDFEYDGEYLNVGKPVAWKPLGKKPVGY